MTARPISGHHRIELLDAIRGLAVCWIFAANVSSLTLGDMKALAGYEPGSWDGLAHGIVNFLFVGKGYALFSLLFGYSFAMQMGSWAEKGVKQTPLYLRRMVILFFIGVVHSLFVWRGDILVLYALMGPLILPFRQFSNHTTFKAIGFLLGIPVFVTWGLTWFYKPSPPNPVVQEAFQAIVTGFADESWTSWFSSNYKVLVAKWRYYYVYNVRFPKVLAMFLLGYLLGRGNFFQIVPLHMPKLRYWWPRLLILSVVANGAMAALTPYTNMAVPNAVAVFKAIAHLAGVLPFALFIAISFILLWEKAHFQRWLSPLTYLGRMSLTNYVAQNMIFVALFAGWGLGMEAYITFAQALLLVPFILILQIGISALWCRFFRFGPLEWIWRMLTYGRFYSLSKPKMEIVS